MTSYAEWRSIDWPGVASKLLKPSMDDRVVASVRRAADAVCQPARRRDVRKCVARLKSPSVVAEAWEAVAPPSWFGDASRRFLPLKPVPSPSAWARHLSEVHGEDFFGERRWLPQPTSLELAAALASNEAGVASAEELARELDRALRLWRLSGGGRPGRPAAVAWALLEPTWNSTRPVLLERASDMLHSSIDAYLNDPAARPNDSLTIVSETWAMLSLSSDAAGAEAARRCGVSGHECDGVGHDYEYALRRSVESLSDALLWRFASSAGVRVSTRDDRLRRHHLIGKRFSALPSPFEAAARIAELGYMPALESADSVTLAVPWVDPLITGPTWSSIGMGLSRSRAARLAGG